VAFPALIAAVATGCAAPPPPVEGAAPLRADAPGCPNDPGAGDRAKLFADSLGVPVYPECQVSPRAYRLREGTRVWVPVDPTKPCLEAIIEYVVLPEGRAAPKTVRVVRTNSEQFLQALIETVPRWRFRPARRDGEAVAQLTRDTAIVLTQGSREAQQDLQFRRRC
jgi:hypothetical protein